MKTFYAKNRREWCKWLDKNHDRRKEIWLIRYKKASNKISIPYDDSVEEALCYGWIDGVIRKNDEESYVQRFTPRRTRSHWSEVNKERVRRLIKAGKMAPAGIKVLEEVDLKTYPVMLSDEVEKTLREDLEVWKNYQKFDETYKRIRIAYIMDAYKQKRIDEYERRLNSFIKATKKNHRIGTIL